MHIQLSQSTLTYFCSHTQSPSLPLTRTHSHSQLHTYTFKHTPICTHIHIHTHTHAHSQTPSHALTCTHPSFHTHTLTQALSNRGLRTQLAIIIGCNLRPKFINLHKAISGKGIIRAIIRNRV